MIKIKFIKDTEKAKKGEIGMAGKKSAESYVRNGYAEYINDSKKNNTLTSMPRNNDIEKFYDLLEHKEQTEIRAIDLFGFVGQKVSNPEIFKVIEEIVKTEGLIVYNGSVKKYKKYHITSKAPNLFSKLLPLENYNEIKEAKIKGLSVFSDKIVCLLDNKKHITLAEGEGQKEVLNKYKKDFEKLIGQGVYFSKPEFIPTKAEKNKIQNFFVSSKEEFVKKIQCLNGKYNLYAGLNERELNKTKAENVKSVKRIFLDIDCKNKPATEEDLQEAGQVSLNIVSKIEGKTGKRPSVIMSGNGYQLIYSIPEIKINDKNRKEVENKIQTFTKELIKKYSNDKVQLDNVGDLPRIIRITGTTNIKGGRVSNFVEYNLEEAPKLKEYILTLKPKEKIENIPVKTKELDTTLQEVLEKDEKVKKLFEGNIEGFKSRSEAELSLICHLIGLNLDKEQIFNVMASCKLGKWQETNVSYRNLTYKKAVEIINKEKNETETGHNDLKTFILDKKELINTKVFTCHMLTPNHFGFGLLLPREEEIKNKKGEVLAKEQKWRPVVISSNRGGLVYGKWFQEKFKTKYEDIPAEMTLRWELEDIDKYLHKNIQKVKGEDLFKQIKKEYHNYLFFREPLWYDIHSLWDIGTYFFMLFSAYPIFENRGLSGTAKTKSMRVSSYITLNATDIMVNPSEATLFRETDSKRPTKYIDEAEKLFKWTKEGMEPDNRVELINSSYTRNGCVPRQEKFGSKYITKWYHVYSPTMISSIQGLFGATETRAITQIHTKAPDKDKRGEREPEDDLEDPKWKEMRNNCYLFALQNWKEIYNEYKNFNIKKYDKETQEEKDIEIKKRDLQIWKPLLVLAKVIDKKDLLPQIIEFAEKTSRLRKADTLSEGTTDFKLLSSIRKILIEEQRRKNLQNYEKSSRIYVNDIREVYNMEFYPNEPRQKGFNKTLSSHLDKLGFKDYRNFDTNKGSYFEIEEAIFNSIVETICPQLNLTQEKK
jgi:hypothetical protein